MTLSTHIRLCLSLHVCVVFFGSAFASDSATFRLEAEDGELVGTSIATSVSGYSGSGYVTGFSDSQDRVTVEFEAEEGVYNVTIGFRAASGEKGFNGAVNGVGFSGMFEASSVFSEYNLGATLLKTGSNTLWIGGGWSFYDIDFIELTEIDPPQPPLPVDAVPVDLNATQEAQDLLDMLASLYGVATLSGQQDIAELGIAHSHVGRTPAILGGDFMEYSPTRLEHESDPGEHTEELIAEYGKGHIITVSWHWNAPSGLIDQPGQEWWRGFYTDAVTFDLAATLADKEGEDYAKLISDIDVIAVELKKLSDANVPVLWRPLHESDGGWFWWGASGREALVELWHILFHRLVDHHGLHNLIWVQTIEDLDWYAGDEYVDIVGIDAYPQDPNDPLASIWGKFLERFDGKKIIALSEFGTVPDVVSMHQLGVWFSYFMSWSGDLGTAGYADKEKLRSLYNSDDVITLDELDLLEDLDGDGLSGLEEADYGSSDAKIDSNDDGTADGVAVAFGFSPMDDLAGFRAFCAAASKTLAIRAADVDHDILIPLGDPHRAPSSGYKITVETSSDLLEWRLLELESEQFVEVAPDSALLRVEFGSAGVKTFFRYSSDL